MKWQHLVVSIRSRGHGRHSPEPNTSLRCLRPADDVTDENFEAAIEEAKAEGNLSRANVKRKVKGEPLPQGKRPEHLRKMRHHDSNRIVEQTVIGLEGYVLAVDLLDLEQIDRSQVAGWSRSLSASLQSLNRLSRQLKELDQP